MNLVDYSGCCWFAFTRKEFTAGFCGVSPNDSLFTWCSPGCVPKGAALLEEALFRISPGSDFTALIRILITEPYIVQPVTFLIALFTFHLPIQYIGHVSTSLYIHVSTLSKWS